MEIIAHCVAEDNEFFTDLQSKINQGFSCFPNMDAAVRFLKSIGILSYDDGVHVHAALSYDDAEVWLNYLVEKQNCNKSNQISFGTMSGTDFEQYCKSLLMKNEFTDVQETSTSCDHGIDLLAEKDGIRYAIQCKCYSSSVGNKAIQEAYSGKGIYNADVAAAMTNSHFTKQAIEDSKRLRVKLWDGDYIQQTFVTS